MERKGHPRIKIDDVDAYNSICEDILNEWIEDFTERDGLTREPTDEDWGNFTCSCASLEDCTCVGFIYTQKGMELHDRAVNRMKAVGMKYFDESGLDIRASHIIDV